MFLGGFSVLIVLHIVKGVQKLKQQKLIKIKAILLIILVHLLLIFSETFRGKNLTGQFNFQIIIPAYKTEKAQANTPNN